MLCARRVFLGSAFRGGGTTSTQSSALQVVGCTWSCTIWARDHDLRIRSAFGMRNLDAQRLQSSTGAYRGHPVAPGCTPQMRWAKATHRAGRAPGG